MGCCPKSLDGYKVAIATERPDMIYRHISDTVPSKVKLELEPTPSDGIVLVNQSRTMRLKELTVDLLYSDRKLSALENGVMVEVADGHPSLEQDIIYEMDVVRSEEETTTMLVRSRQRTLKKTPSSLDVLKRAIASANKDPTMTASLLDITSMSFAMRERV